MTRRILDRTLDSRTSGNVLTVKAGTANAENLFDLEREPRW